MKKNKWFKTLLRRRLIFALLLLIQLAFLVLAVVYGGNYYPTLSIILTVISLVVALCILANDSASAFKLTWVFLILTFPLFGGLVYVMFKAQSHTKKFARRQQQVEQTTKPLYRLPSPVAEQTISELERLSPHIKYLESFAGFPVYANTETEYLPSGEEMFERLCRELEQAKRYIFLEYFIFQEGKMWDTVLEILRRKVEQGVEVRVIYDDIGCFLKLPKNYANTLRGYGIKCIVFNPFRPVFSAIQNNRDHRKIASIDGTVAFTGGINLADEYINNVTRYGHWKDTAIMLKGHGAWSLTLMFLEMWAVAGNTAEDCSAFYPFDDRPAAASDGYVQPYCDSPMDRENVGEHVYLNVIKRATEYLYISTPYLIIDETTLSAITLAAKSGVDVRIITPHVPDKKVVHAASRSHYRELIDAGVKVYEYTPGFIHAKVFVSDDCVATVGTANLDYRSLYLHFECGVCLYDCSSIEDIKQDLLSTLESCQQITASNSPAKPINRFFRALLRLYSPLM